MNEYVQSNLCFSEDFRMLYYIFSGSRCTYFIDSGHQRFLSIKHLKNGIFEAIILKQKRRSATEVIYVLVILLKCLYPVQLYIFWKWLHTFHWN